MTLAFSLFLDGSKLDERKVKVELTGLKIKAILESRR